MGAAQVEAREARGGKMRLKMGKLSRGRKGSYMKGLGGGGQEGGDCGRWLMKKDGRKVGVKEGSRAWWAS